MDSANPFGEERIARLWASYDPKSFQREELLAEEHVLARAGRYTVFFGPLGAWPDPTVKAILVGLTPGFQQLEAAARLFSQTSTEVRSNEAAFSQLLRRHVAFAGTMRRNLCEMLDAIDFHHLLGIGSSADLFGNDSGKIAATSALVYPVMVGSEHRNFSGTKDLTRIGVFCEMLDRLLAPRLLRAPGAMIIPLGKAAESAVQYLARRGVIERRRILSDFPHPSGANGHRKRLFAENEVQLRSVLKVWFAPSGGVNVETR